MPLPSVVDQMLRQLLLSHHVRDKSDGVQPCDGQLSKHLDTATAPIEQWLEEIIITMILKSSILLEIVFTKGHFCAANEPNDE